MNNNLLKISFNEGKHDEIDFRLQFAIPDGFHSNAKPRDLHDGIYLFSVPENWPLSLESTSAPFYFYVELAPFKTHELFDIEKLDFYKNMYSSWLMGNFFDEDMDIHHVSSDKINIMYQFLTGEPYDFVRVTSILFVGKVGYSVHFVYNYGDISVDQNAVFDWFHELLSRWVSEMKSINEWKDQLL